MQTPQERYRFLVASILDAIDAIDKDTPWRETEPEWWVKMKELERVVIEQRKQLNQ